MKNKLANSVLLSITLSCSLQAGRTLTLDTSSFEGNGTFSGTATSPSPFISGSSLGMFSGTIDTAENATSYEMKYEVLGGGAVNLSFGTDPADSSLSRLIVTTTGNVTGIKFEFLYGDALRPRFRQRILGASLRQASGAVTASATAKFFGQDGTQLGAQDLTTGTTTDVDQSVLWSSGAAGEVVAFNSDTAADGKTITTSDLSTAAMSETVSDATGASTVFYNPRFAALGSSDDHILGGQSYEVTANGGGSFDAGSSFNFTFDGKVTTPSTVTPFTSTIPIPEPTSSVGLLTGTLLLLRRKRVA